MRVNRFLGMKGELGSEKHKKYVMSSLKKGNAFSNYVISIVISRRAGLYTAGRSNPMQCIVLSDAKDLLICA